MEQQKSIKTHLIITDIHEEYSISWCGRIIDSNPIFKNNLPVFAVVGGAGRVELNTVDMQLLENTAKKLTYPRGREATTSDNAYIYIKEVGGHEKLVCIVTHYHIKKYASMYDKVGFR